MAKIVSLFQIIKNDILQGKYGKSGDKFLTIRQFCIKTDISYVTAIRIFEKLKNENLIFLFGNNHYICTGLYYKNSPLHTAIKSNNLKTRIGLHIRDITNPFFTALSQELFGELRKFDFELIIMTSNNIPKEEKNILNEFIKLGCSGVLSFAGFKDNDLYNFYSNYPLPYILIGRSIEEIKTDYITTDNFGSGNQAAKYLVNYGYKKFGYIGLKNLDEANDSRYLGFKKGLSDLNYAIDSALYFRIDIEDNINYIYKSIKKSSLENSLGFFCYHDLLAVKILNLCSYNKLSIPETVGIIGYDDLPISRAVNPSITTFSYNYNNFAKLAVEVLLHKMETLINCNETYIVQTSMILRKSICDLKIL